MKQDKWPEYEALRRIAVRLLRAWGRPVEWADDTTQQVWFALQQVDAAGRSKEIKSRPAYAIMAVRSVVLKSIRAETRAEVGLPEHLAMDSIDNDFGVDLVALARQELDSLSASARSQKQRRCSDIVRVIFELLLRHYETTGERLSFSEAYRQLPEEHAAQSSEKALRYHFEKFRRTVIRTVQPIRKGTK